MQVCPFLAFISKWVPREQSLFLSNIETIFKVDYTHWSVRQSIFRVLTLLSLGKSMKSLEAYFSVKTWLSVTSSSFSSEAMIFAGLKSCKDTVLSQYLSRVDMPTETACLATLAFLKGTNFHHNASGFFYFHLLPLIYNNNTLFSVTNCSFA